MSFSGVVWQVITRGTLFSQEILNVFYYGDSASGGSAADLAVAFGDDVVDHILQAVNSDFTLNTIDVFGVKGVSDLFTLIVNQPGTRTGECLPVFNAFAYRLGRSAIGLRNGYKRFAGVDEGDQANGTVTASWLSTRGIPLADALALEIPTSTPKYVPLIRTTRRNKIVLDVPEYNIIGAIQFVGISTQNTRKVGHGH